MALAGGRRYSKCQEASSRVKTGLGRGRSHNPKEGSPHSHPARPGSSKPAQSHCSQRQPRSHHARDSASSTSGTKRCSYRLTDRPSHYHLGIVFTLHSISISQYYNDQNQKKKKKKKTYQRLFIKYSTMTKFCKTSK